MPRLTIDSATTKITKDDVITATELASMANVEEAKADPAKVAAKLDQYETAMTPTAKDRYDAFKAALATPPNSGSALDVLTGKVAVKPTLPSWFPAGLDLNAAAAGFKALMAQQAAHRGKPADAMDGSVDKVDFWDIDLTLAQSDSPVILVNKNDPTEVLHYPSADDVPAELRGRIVYLGVGSGHPNNPGRDFSSDMNDLKNSSIASIKNMPWADYAPDFRSFGDPEPLLRTSFVQEDVNEMLKAQKDSSSRAFINTSRSDGLVPDLIADDLMRKGIDVDGAMAVNNPAIGTALQFPATGLSSAQKKAVGMAAAITAYGADKIKQVRFFDDTDANQIAAMQLLPKLFPGIEVKFVGVVHSSAGYHQRLDARIARSGELVDNKNKPLSVTARDGFITSQGALPFEAIYGGDPTALGPNGP